MYKLEIPEREGLNLKTNEFINVKACTLHLEHSLLTISKWESKWHKPFLSGETHSEEESLSYFKCMCLDKDVDPNVWYLLTPLEKSGILRYIDDPMSGTTFRKEPNAEGNDEIMSSELMYYYMAQNQIPFSCEKWHLNRLLTLLRICGIKNKVNDKPKSSQSQLLNKYASMHAARKKAKK